MCDKGKLLLYLIQFLKRFPVPQLKALDCIDEEVKVNECKAVFLVQVISSKQKVNPTEKSDTTRVL